MRKKLFSFTVCIFTSALCLFSPLFWGGAGGEALASTSIPAGNVNGTWTLAGSPYNIQGSIQIVNGDSLIIQPGVSVVFQGTYQLAVQGKLKAIGTVNDTIVFTAANTTTGWLGIRFNNTPSTNDTSRIIYCKIQYGKATGTSPYDCGGALYFNNFSKVIISKCNISNCTAIYGGGGVACVNSGPAITGNTISNNSSSGGTGGGIYCEGGGSTITGNTIANNSS